MPPRVRRLALTTHVVSSVGWLGAVVATLALAVTGVTSQDEQQVRAAYLMLDLTARLVLVPLALASLVSGTVQALGTPWGLLRHYWVLVKLLITATATAVLLTYTQTLAALADAASQPGTSVALDAVSGASPIVHAGAALLLLLAATALSVFKPRGMTRRGQRAHGVVSARRVAR